MSYILDALKRADAERERGQVPGLHSQVGPSRTPATPLAGALASARGPVKRIAWTAALLLAAAAAAYWWFRPAVDAPVQTLPPAQPGMASPQHPAPAAPAILSAPQEPAAPLLAPEPPVAKPQAPAQKPAQPAAAAVLRYTELSPEQRSQLPQLSVNGASHSANPAHRLLIVNGAVLQEGQDVVPGLILERIGAHEAVFNRQGLRFSVSY